MDLTQTTENLLQNLDELIESALMHQQPHGLILDRARSKIKDQHDRIGEMWDALEHLRNERNEMKTDRDIARLNALESDRIHDRMVGELEAIYKERDEARDALRIIANCENWFHTTKEEGGPYTAWRGNGEPDEIAMNVLECAK